MSKADILSELPKLDARERAEIFAKLCELEDSTPTAAERAILDQELEDFKNDPNPGSPGHEVEARLRSGLKA
ncbi:MAG: hypothetical protein K0Q55_928 [Verrucomicrobia bacterium]|jgi:hypothetical protein|nr:hypothetical protein [Verrucomicrobiota bacterium]